MKNQKDLLIGTFYMLRQLSPFHFWCRHFLWCNVRWRHIRLCNFRWRHIRSRMRTLPAHPQMLSELCPYTTCVACRMFQ
jgi:hypothetical protein